MKNLALRTLGVLRYRLAYYLLDRLTAPAVNPSKTIIVSGFWRSGTTWLQQSLNQIFKAKTVFEPFHPYVSTYRRYLKNNNPLPEKKIEDFTLFMPYARASEEKGTDLHGFLNSALQSRIPGRWVRQIRTGIRESLRSRVVLKVIRGQLLLEVFQKTFGCPIIHIHRDPRAVLASLDRGKWTPFMDRLNLQDQLLTSNDGRSDFFEEWRDRIIHCDTQDPLVRMAAYWALTEKYVEAQLNEPDSTMLSLSYEQFCRKPEQTLLQIIEHFGIADETKGPLLPHQTTAPTTADNRRSLSVEDRISGWKRELSPARIDQVHTVIEDFAMEHRLDV